MSAINENFLDQLAGEGLDAFKASDLPKPFIKIAQKNSPEVDQRDPEAIEGLKEGMFFNTLTKEVYGDKLNLIVIGYENAWLVYGDNLGDFKGKYPPAAFRTVGSPFAKEKKDKVKVNDPKFPELQGFSVVDSMIFYVVNADKPQDGIAILSLSSGNIKHAQNWAFSIIHAVRTNAKGEVVPAPLYGYVWHLELTYNSKNGNSWYALGVGDKTTIEKDMIDDGNGGKKPREITADIWNGTVKQARQMVIAGTVKADYALLSDETGGASTGTDMTQY